MRTTFFCSRCFCEKKYDQLCVGPHRYYTVHNRAAAHTGNRTVFSNWQCSHTTVLVTFDFILDGHRFQQGAWLHDISHIWSLLILQNTTWFFVCSSSTDWSLQVNNTWYVLILSVVWIRFVCPTSWSCPLLLTTGKLSYAMINYMIIYLQKKSMHSVFWYNF